MTSRSQTISVAFGLPVVLLVLAGCFLLPEAPTELTTPSSTVEPTVEPPLDAPFEPAEFPDRLPNQCSTILQRDVVADVLEVPVNSVALVEEPLDYAGAVLEQGGARSCVWTGVPGTGPGSPQLTVHILVGAETAYGIYLAHNPAALETSSPDHVEGGIGEDSQFSCTVEIDRLCSGIFEKWGTWVEFTFGGPVTVAGSVDATDAVSIGEHILRALSGSTSSYVYEVPAGYLHEWSDCAQLDPDGSFLSDLGSPSLLLDEAPDNADFEATSTKRARAASCRWTNDSPSSGEGEELSFLETSILPAGEWAWPDVRDNAVSQPQSAEGTVGGAAQIISWCAAAGDNSDCSAVALVKHSILHVTARASSDGSLDARAAALDALDYLINRLK